MLTTVVTELSENVNNGQNLHALEDLVYENGVIGIHIYNSKVF